LQASECINKIILTNKCEETTNILNITGLDCFVRLVKLSGS